jgi:hypothetical protein
VIARRAGVALATVFGLLACGEVTWPLDPDSGTDSGGSGSQGDASRPGCTSDADCRYAHCDVPSGQCVPCVDSSQCTQPGLPRCDSALHLCVPCGVTGNCAAGQVCEADKCVPSCADGGTCATGLTCSQPRAVCVACSTDADCVGAAGGPVCDINSGQCGQCTSDAQCKFPTPRCDYGTDRCVQCLTGADCDDHVCNSATFTCVSDDDGGEDGL